MSRVININNPGKIRSQQRRTIAEVLRLLMQKGEIDGEAKDMVATLVFALRKIGDTIDVTVDAWEKRNYYLKADRFRLDWEWVYSSADRIEKLVVKDRWDMLPLELAALSQRFADIKIAKITRSASTWQGNHRALLEAQ